MISPVNEAALEVGALLLSTPDTATRASIIASVVATQLPNCACAVHRFVHEDVENAWTVVGLAGDISLEPTTAGSGNRLMAPWMLESPEPLIYANADILREDYSHLRIARSVSSIAYVPLLQGEDLVGAVEILFFSGTPRLQDLEAIAPIVQLAAPAILASEGIEAQRQDLLDSVHRMSQLYDLEKSLNATLEMDAVTALVPVKAAAILPCQAIHLWMFDGEILRLISTHGEDSTVETGMTQAPGEGLCGRRGRGRRSAADCRCRRRTADFTQFAPEPESETAPVTNALLVPLMQDEAEIGVLEAINKQDGVFDDDDQFLMMSMAETIANALKNASLMLAERKLEILKALVDVSAEITSTLRLDRLLGIIANSPQNVLPYERCAIALDQRGKLQLKAVSGMATLPLGDVTVERLNQLMRWLTFANRTCVHLRNVDNGEIPAPVAEYFAATGYRALYAMPLADDQGRVGVLIYESSDADFLDVPHIEMIKILAGQATVAIRNAMLYRDVPLISLIEPLVKKKQALMNNRRSRWMALGVLFEGALLLSFLPLPMRVAGDAVVAPQHLVTIAAPVDGNVTSVYAHEGQRVARGDVLGAMNDWQWRAELASSEAKYQQAMLVMQNDLSRGAAQSGADRQQAEFLHAEFDRARARVDEAKLRSPIDGIVVTPDLQNVAGKRLDAGTAFAQVLDLSSALVQVSIPERDTVLMSPGERVAIKLDSYPQRTWRGTVSVVSPEAKAGDGDRTFTVEVPLSNADASLRTGMTGRAKISLGWKPAGYVLLRRPALWVWQTLWNWIGW